MLLCRSVVCSIQLRTPVASLSPLSSLSSSSAQGLFELKAQERLAQGLFELKGVTLRRRPEGRHGHRLTEGRHGHRLTSAITRHEYRHGVQFHCAPVQSLPGSRFHGPTVAMLAPAPKTCWLTVHSCPPLPPLRGWLTQQTDRQPEWTWSGRSQSSCSRWPEPIDSSCSRWQPDRLRQTDRQTDRQPVSLLPKPFWLKTPRTVAMLAPAPQSHSGSRFHGQ